ncbi:ABC-2 transporter permease [Clostridium sporogenes]|uniref:ABC-2 transporter permease n=1 Tax=Clostridium botulinum TaxID=1491 RepID=A0A6M0T257_CLOBO|nr:ABC-2 transporter permease [Clostridium sporogenes]NFA61856.1 ABC-2 transporter permease [Clostridium botulinum]NFI73885.1 ABC-2 transporter permease [Clostridium sporogenes]NFL71697.1 ABC-2 transporter permease [Clostridium sporogenes]NFM24325.1 ABC-2 transporter permease [Clostridium sporogenes]NFP61759.1 ABC-2 transporter permease [Clostridium sporogenes]
MKKIINLIINDLILCRKIFLVSIPMVISLVFLGLESNSSGDQHYIYIYVIGMTSYILINYVEQAIVKNNSNIFIYSLPIEKNNIVLEKYLFVIVTNAINWCICILSTILFLVILKGQSMRSMCSISDFIFAATLVSAYYCIYYPFYFKLGPNKVNLFIKYLYMIILLLPMIIPKILRILNISISKKAFYGQINFIQDKFLWIILFDIIIVTISVYISTIIHKNKTIMYE